MAIVDVVFALKQTKLGLPSPHTHWKIVHLLRQGVTVLSPFKLASTMGDCYQTTLESNFGTLAMNVDEVESLLKPCPRVQIEELNDEFGSMGGRGN